MLYKLLTFIILAVSSLTGGLAPGKTPTNALAAPQQAAIVAQDTISNLLQTIHFSSQTAQDNKTIQQSDGEDNNEPKDVGAQDEDSQVVQDGQDLPKDQGRFCSGSSTKDQPEAARLAQQFGVTTQEITGWFCQNYGFGEIRMAYSIAAQKAVPVADVFAKLAGGEDWGKIMQAYELRGNPNNNGQPNPKNKGIEHPVGHP
jgi:hypothetical protein